MTEARDRLIIALDVSTAAAARKIVAAVGESASTFKVGNQLFTAEGPQIVRELIGSGRKVFLDLKFHDIPNTVSGAVAEAARLKVSMLTVHAGGGAKMLQAAAQAAGLAGPMVLAVTVLTSLGDQDLDEVGISGRVVDQVLRLANLARVSGCGGIVASPMEARGLRRELGTGFAIVTPGVRPAGGDQGDQARVNTPAEAVAAGATHLVVGRPVTTAKDPGLAAQKIVEEIAAAGVPISA